MNTAVCRFCGQVVTTGNVFLNAEEAEEWASRHCECAKSVIYNMVENCKEQAELFISSAEMTDEQRKIIPQLIEWVGYKVIDKVSVSLDGKNTISVSKKANGKIVFKIKESISSQLEL